MIGRIALALGLLVLPACRASTDTAPPAASRARPAPLEPAATTPTAAAKPKTTKTQGSCPALARPQIVEEAYVQGVEFLEDSKEGEHYMAKPFEDAMADLKLAAENGHRAAMTLYGSTLFGSLFTNQAPIPEEAEEYISALGFLRIAAKAGDEDAAGYMTGLTAEKPDLTHPPLNELPADWVLEAFERADAWIECHGLPKG